MYPRDGTSDLSPSRPLDRDAGAFYYRNSTRQRRASGNKELAQYFPSVVRIISRRVKKHGESNFEEKTLNSLARARGARGLQGRTRDLRPSGREAATARVTLILHYTRDDYSFRNDINHNSPSPLTEHVPRPP